MGQWDVVTEIESLSVSEHEAALPHPPWLLASGVYVLTLSSAALLLAPSVPHPKRNMPGHATHHAKRRCGSLVRPWGWEGRPLVLEPVKRTPQSRGCPGERDRQLCRTPAAGWVSAPSQPDICHLPACAGSLSTRPGVLGSGLWSVGAQTQTLRFTAMIDHQAAPGQWSSKEW